MEKLHQLVDRINGTYEDIRAEVIVSDLLAGNLRPEDLIIRFNGQQKRAKSKDIDHVEVVHKKHSRTKLELTLNRDSIYDTLPEGIFHQPSDEIKTGSVSEMVDEYQRQQQEEEEARRFFAPFENELFFQKSLIESEEFQQLFQVQQSRLSGEVLETLGIDASLPPAFTARLLRILPYNSHIAGNKKRTEKIFSLLLRNKVSLKSGHFTMPYKNDHNASVGESTLGADTTVGNQVIPAYLGTKLVVGPISKNKLLLYKNDGWKQNALQTIINFFIPVEWELVVEFNIQKEETKSFFLNDHQSDARLGYTTTL
jgi:hypothetical protein